MSTPFLSVVVPTFNEESRIASFIERMRSALPALVPSWEIVVADDGSADRTREIVAAIAAADDHVRLLALPHAGKGQTVCRGLLEARGAWRFMADADLAMPPDNLSRFLAHVEDGTDLIIGSREAPGAQRVEEPWTRHTIGRAFNGLVRLVVLPGINDTQCGFKLLSARAVETICPTITTAGFAFDVEMLALARRAGFSIKEVGITWNGRQESRVAIGRGAAAFVDVLRIGQRLGHLAQSDAAQPAVERLWRVSVRTWAYGIAAITAAALAYDLMRIPVQVFDALEEILAAQRSPSALASFVSAAYNAAYLRPLRIAQIKILFDMADGHYWLVFRGFHALLMVACLVLFIRALRVRTATDLCAAAFALMVLTGVHTFRTTVQEAFPINHFLEMVVFALVALNLAQSRPRALVDVAAAITFVAAVLTLESGLLVWVVAVTCWILGLRGISTRGLAFMTTLLACYFYARFVSLSVGVPTLVERGSGFMFGMLDPQELQARFGDHPSVFYAYNVTASMLSILFSEPQGGIFVAIRSWVDSNVPPRVPLAVGSSLVTTALMIVASLRIQRRYWTADASDRLILLFFVILVANAILSFAYTKDDIMSIAGAFYALAAYAAVRRIAGDIKPDRRLAAASVTVLLCLTASVWSLRSLGVHHVAGLSAFKTRNDWASQPGLWKRSGRWPADLPSQTLILHLRNDALSMRVPNPFLEPRWHERVWGD